MVSSHTYPLLPPPTPPPQKKTNKNNLKVTSNKTPKYLSFSGANSCRRRRMSSKWRRRSWKGICVTRVTFWSRSSTSFSWHRLGGRSWRERWGKWWDESKSWSPRKVTRWVPFVCVLAFFIKNKKQFFSFFAAFFFLPLLTLVLLPYFLFSPMSFQRIQVESVGMMESCVLFQLLHCKSNSRNV